MGEARSLQRPWRRRRRRGLRALPIRALAFLSLALVTAAVVWLYERFRDSEAGVPNIVNLAAGVPQELAPRPVDEMPGVLDRAGDTIAFPDLSRFGWRPIGTRRDEMAGRAAVPGGLTLAVKRQGRTVLTSPGADAAFGPTPVRLAAYRTGGRLAF